jgi:hypothetical protein
MLYYCIQPLLRSGYIWLYQLLQLYAMRFKLGHCNFNAKNTNYFLYNAYHEHMYTTRLKVTRTIETNSFCCRKSLAEGDLVKAWPIN